MGLGSVRNLPVSPVPVRERVLTIPPILAQLPNASLKIVRGLRGRSSCLRRERTV